MNAAEWWGTLDQCGFTVMRMLLSVLWQSSIVFGAMALLVWVLRKRRATARHALWVVALLVAPALPLLTSLASRTGAPQAPVSVLPTYQERLAVPPAALEDVTPLPPVGPVAAAPGVTEPEASAGEQPRASVLEYPWALLLVAYVAGVVFFLAWTALGRIRLRQWIVGATPALDERVRSAFAEAKERFGLRREFLTLESLQVPAPLTAGFLRPVVLLPKGLSDRLTDAELRAVALHETAHVVRRDPLILSLIPLVRAVLFFHPLVWLACRQVSLLAEQAADDAVLDATGEPVAYAKMLTRLAKDLRRRSFTTELAAGIVLSKGAFLRRVEAILSDRRDQLRRLSRWALACTVLAALLSLALAAALPLGEKKGTEESADAAEGTPLEAPAALGVGVPSFSALMEGVVGTNTFIDFDAGRLFTFPEDFLRLTSEEQLVWIRDRGVDASAEAESHVRGLAGMDMLAEPVLPGAWETLTAADAAESVSLRTGVPKGPVWLTAKEELPATYLIRTCDGGLGIMQVLGFTDKPWGLKIRYTMIQFPGREKRVFLPDVDESPMMLDLARGRLFYTPDMGEDASEEELFGAINARERGDLAYGRALICLRGATADGELDPTYPEWESAHTYKITEPLPMQLTVTTAEGRLYVVRVLRADNRGCELAYYEASTPNARKGSEEPPLDAGSNDSLDVEGGTPLATSHEARKKDQPRAISRPAETTGDPRVPGEAFSLTTKTQRGITIRAVAGPKRLSFDVGGPITAGQSIPLVARFKDSEELTEEQKEAKDAVRQLLAASGSFVVPRRVQVVRRSTEGQIRVAFMFDGEEDPDRRIKLTVALKGIGGTVLKRVTKVCSDQRIWAKTAPGPVFHGVRPILSRGNAETIQFSSVLKALVRGIEIDFAEAEKAVSPTTKTNQGLTVVAEPDEPAWGEVVEGVQEARLRNGGEGAQRDIRTPEVGKPSLELVLEEGAGVTLAQFKGKPVVLAFVSIYSRPCVKVLDQLRALQEEKGADALGVIAVHDRTATPEEIEQFRKDQSIPFPIVRVPEADRDGWDSTTFRTYGITALPTVVRIDAEGKVESVGEELAADGGIREEDKQELPWGEPVNGLQVRFSPDKRRYSAGGVMQINLEVRNVGSSPVHFESFQNGSRMVLKTGPFGPGNAYYNTSFSRPFEPAGYGIVTLAAGETYAVTAELPLSERSISRVRELGAQLSACPYFVEAALLPEDAPPPRPVVTDSGRSYSGPTGTKLVSNTVSISFAQTDDSADERSFHLRGRVLLPDGRPAAGATVGLMERDAVSKRWAPMVTRTTDDKGHYDLGWQAVPMRDEKRPSYAALYATLKGYAIQGATVVFQRSGGPGLRALEVTKEQVTYDLKLMRSVSYGGTIVGSDSKPLQGVTVWVTAFRMRNALGRFEYIYAPTDYQKTETEQEGRFQVGDVPAGGTVLCGVEKKGHVIARFGLTESGDNTFTLPEAGAVEGRVIFQDTGKPAANVRVFARSSGGRRGPSDINVTYTESVQAVTDEQGRFKLEPLLPGKASVRIDLKRASEIGYTAEKGAIATVQGGGTTSGVVLELIKGTILRGLVVDAVSGKPVLGAHLQVDRSVGDGWEGYPHPETDAQGRYSLRVPVGTYRLRFADAEGYVTGGYVYGFSAHDVRFESVTVKEGQETQAPTIKAAPAATVTVKVRTAAGRPAPGILVNAEGDSMFGGRSGRTDDSGDVRFPGLKPGATVQVSARNATGTLLGSADVTPKTGDENEVVIRLVSTSPGKVIGTLINEAGRAIVGAEVSLDEPSGDDGWRRKGFASSGAGGRFEMTGLSPGSDLVLRVGAPGYGWLRSQRFSLDSGQTQDMGTLTLARADREIAGRVVDRNDVPVAGLRVQVSGRQSQPPQLGRTDKGGRFQFSGLVNEPLSMLVWEETTRKTLVRTNVEAGDKEILIRILALGEEPKPEVVAEVGKPAPELVLEEGAGVSLAQFKGKPVVLAFVSIYSRPCVKVLDELKALQEEKGSDRLSVIAVHDRTGTPEEIEQFRRDHSITFPIVRVPQADRDGWESEAFRAYGVTALPTVVLLDTQAKTLSIGGGSGLSQGISRLLQN